jgi:hypothetical protein
VGSTQSDRSAAPPLVSAPHGRAHDVPEDLRATVTVSREHPKDVGQRQIIVQLDAGRKVKLCFGEWMTEELEPGHHHLRVHNTLMWKNIDFTIEPGEHLEFIVINSARWWTPGVVGVLGAAPLFLKVERVSLR